MSETTDKRKSPIAALLLKHPPPWSWKLGRDGSTREVSDGNGVKFQYHELDTFVSVACALANSWAAGQEREAAIGETFWTGHIYVHTNDGKVTEFFQVCTRADSVGGAADNMMDAARSQFNSSDIERVKWDKVQQCGYFNITRHDQEQRSEQLAAGKRLEAAAKAALPFITSGERDAELQAALDEFGKVGGC